MKVSQKEIVRQIESLEAVRGANERLRMEISKMDITPHIGRCYVPVHDDIEAGGHTFVNLAGGRGSGKSSYVALEIVNQLMKDTTGLSNCLVIRKYANTLRGSVFNQVLWALDVLGVADRWRSTYMPLQFQYETGQVIRFAGLDDPTKLKSLRPPRGFFRLLWIEEFSEITNETELRNLQQSVLRGGSGFTVFRSYNPPISSNNWVNQYVDQDDRALTVRTDYTMIPPEWLGETFIEEAERLKEINPAAYEHEFLGVPVGNGSEVFPNLEIRQITDEEVNNVEVAYQGLDFGFSSDPFAFVRVGYDRKTDTILFMDEIVKRGCGNREIAEQIRERGYDKTGRQVTGFLIDGSLIERQLTTCDCAEPKSISDLQDMGLKVTGCHKEPGCKQYRTRWLQRRRIVIDPERTPVAAKEFQNYCYVVDRKTGEITSQLPDKDDHCIDACSYALDRLIYRKGISA